MKKNISKKSRFIVMMAVMVFLVVSCSDTIGLGQIVSGERVEEEQKEKSEKASDPMEDSGMVTE
ncbi:MAG: hypothetical protein FWG99_03965 [Treponema sp.]|nr:hypothetical protein [Treponema sp.]